MVVVNNKDLIFYNLSFKDSDKVSFIYEYNEVASKKNVEMFIEKLGNGLKNMINLDNVKIVAHKIGDQIYEGVSLKKEYVKFKVERINIQDVEIDNYMLDKVIKGNDNKFLIVVYVDKLPQHKAYEYLEKVTSLLKEKFSNRFIIMGLRQDQKIDIKVS